MFLTAKNFGLQEENINISKPQGNTTNYENGTGYHRKRRASEGQKERERGREDAVLYEKERENPDRCRKCLNYR